MHVTAIHRYPVKGLNPAALEAVDVEPGGGVPGDRRFALARAGARVDPATPKWATRGHFLALVRDPHLAKLRVDFDPTTSSMSLRHDGVPGCAASTATAEGRRAVEIFVDAFLAGRAGAPVRLIEADTLSFTDIPENLVSLIGLASVRDLEAKMGAPLDPLRFRGNVYFEGGRPWEEFAWVGREIHVGGVTLAVTAPTSRCAATMVNPDTGMRDLNVPKGLKMHCGHTDMGVYARVVAGGRLAVGDRLQAPATPARSRVARLVGVARFYGRNVVVGLRGRAR